MDEREKQLRKKGVPGYKYRRWKDKLFGDDEPEKKEEKKDKKSKYPLIDSLFKKKK